MKTTRILEACFIAAVVGGILCLGAPDSRAAARTVVAVLETTPTAPGQDFSFALSLQPQDIDISGFHVRIAFDGDALTFVGMEDNTGQAGVTYVSGDPVAYSVSGKPTINTSVQVAMQAGAGDLVRPQLLGRVVMRTNASYAPPLQIHVEDANLNRTDGLTGPVPFPYVEHRYDMSSIGQPASQVGDYWAY